MAEVQVEKISVFSKRLKISIVLAERVWKERLFHVVGATTEKALEANAVLVLGTTSRRVSEEERSDFVGTDRVSRECR